MSTTTSNNSYWNNISSDQFFDSDDFDLPSYFIYKNEYDHHTTTIKEEHEETSLPFQSDQEQFQTLSTNNSAEESRLPNRICGVCGAPATGYNFDQITCESCKAFFRRNALRDMAAMKCRYTGSCVINIQTRRQCPYCRLKKCFDIKMRKDWIRTEEEKEVRQLQKLIKGQKNLNKPTNNQQFLLDFPIVIRKKKRLMIKPIRPEFLDKPVNVND